MQEKSVSRSTLFSPRASGTLVLCTAACSIVTGTALALFHSEAPTKVSQRTLTFAERVEYQRAIEEVYWQHRIWPKANAGPKPPLDKVMSQAQVEKKVEDYLRDSQALEDYWQKPISRDQLQAEMERIASHTKQPGVLRELFAALGNDPFVIAECLARPVLAERLLTVLYAHDQRFHRELKQRAEAELQAHQSLKQMKQTSGMYTEMEWIKSDSTPDQDKCGSASLEDDGKANGQRRGAEHGVTLNSQEWNDGVQKLAKDFGNTQAGNALAQIKTGTLSPLQEDDAHYYAVAVMNKGQDRLKLATVAWLKEPLRSWLAKAEAQAPVTMSAVSANYTLPVIASQSENWSPSGGCTDDTWTPTSFTGVPSARDGHTAVWTGSEMILWGGYDGTFFNTGGRYNPSTDSWTATSTTGAPASRAGHTAVWTGSEMIVWGATYDSTGGRYNPGTDSWTATSTTNAPFSRFGHTAVWTGSEMIVWGGIICLNDGGRFNPRYIAGAPKPEGACFTLNDGGKYNPSTDSWTATSATNAPGDRYVHTAVWTGSEMIIWGGEHCNFGNCTYLNTGGRYNPGTDSWTATSITNAPAARYYHTAVWAGSEMIVWGGYNGSYLNTGGRYDPSADSWTATTNNNAPAARYNHTAVLDTAGEMIVWGGYNGSYLNTGGRYNPTTDSWTATNAAGPPSGRDFHTAVWTGSEMILWGGDNPNTYFNTGGRYNPSTDSWAATSTTNAPAGRTYHTAVWTGGEMVVWGGTDGYSVLNTGGRYNPGTDSWTATSITNAPAGRDFHTAVWTGSQMIIWGGVGGGYYLSSGGRYNPGTDSWTATSIIDAPAPRYYHTAVWTGSEMIVWGGTDNVIQFNTGGRYNPSTDSWTATSLTNAPAGRTYHTAVWTATDSEMIVWGGEDQNFNPLNTGGRYNPGADSWTATSTTNSPDARLQHTAVWTDSEMIVWGGTDGPSVFNTGGRYNPSTDSWTATSTTNAPDARYAHTAVWTRSEMIVWGGGSYLNTGGRYCAAAPGATPTPTPTPTATPTAIATPTPTSTPRPTPTPRPRPTPAPRPSP